MFTILQWTQVHISSGLQASVVSIIPAELVMLLEKKLKHSEDGAYGRGRRDTGGDKRNECLPGTRTDLLQRIWHWVHDIEDFRIFWLNGMAGTGKSTIADSAVIYARAQGVYGASFFCSRDFTTASDIYMIIPTLVFELAHSLPHYSRHLAKALQASPYPSVDDLKEQLSDLLIAPLEEMSKTHPLPHPYIIVIDALDECNFASTDQTTFIDLLLRHTDTFCRTRIKFFLTSRPIDEIRSVFVDEQTVRHHYRENLHDEPLEAVQYDISIFVQDALSKITPRITFTQEQIKVIAEKAGPLFIFASILCKFIAKSRYEPQKRLDCIVAELTTATSGGVEAAQKGLDVLYQRIFQDAFEGENEEVQARIRTVIGTILHLREPLSIINLALLLGPPYSDNPIPEKLRDFLKDLHSVLSISDDDGFPVRAFHASFEDHLTTPTRALHAFYIDRSVHHLQLAVYCFSVMEEHLIRDNICDLQPNMRYGKVSDLKERRLRYIPEVLVYACRYWVDHLDHGFKHNRTRPSRDRTKVHHKLPCDEVGLLVNVIKDHLQDFASKRFLRWVDALIICWRTTPGNIWDPVHDALQLERARDILIVRISLETRLIGTNGRWVA